VPRPPNNGVQRAALRAAADACQALLRSGRDGVLAANCISLFFLNRKAVMASRRCLSLWLTVHVLRFLSIWCFFAAASVTPALIGE
jgi:hypothetical protein